MKTGGIEDDVARGTSQVVFLGDKSLDVILPFILHIHPSTTCNSKEYVFILVVPLFSTCILLPYFPLAWHCGRTVIHDCIFREAFDGFIPLRHLRLCKGVHH